MLRLRHHPAWFLLAIFLALAHSPCQPRIQAAQDVWSGVERIVAVGDIHGDYDQFVAVLRMAGLIGEEGNWSGGTTHLVQTGDVPDRGPDSRNVMHLLMKLEAQAKKAGGYVHALIANHEAMNIYGDLRYVHPGEFEAFRDKKSERLRERYYREHIREMKSNAPLEGLPAFDETYKLQWERGKPLGWFEHRLNFAPEGKYGKWILRHNAVIKINDSLFLHGGIGPKYGDLSIREMNDRVRRDLRNLDFQQLREGIVMDEQGPLWYRGLARNDEQTEEPHLEALLKRHDVKRIVMGHTVTIGTVMPRFDGRAIFLDVGLAKVYGSRLASLLIEDGRLYTLHRGQKLELPTDSGGSLLQYLKQAAALDPPPSPLRPIINELELQLATK